MDNGTPLFYIAIPQNVLYNVSISPTAKLLYGVIDSFQLQTGICYATNKRLAEEVAGCSERTISRCISELQEAGLILIDTSKPPKGKQPCRKISLCMCARHGQGVDKIGDPPRQNWRTPLDKNGDIVTKESKKEKKTIDPLPVFVSWIADSLHSESSDSKNRLYLCLLEYTEMRKDSKSPLNTKRKVDGLLEDLWEQSRGQVPLMCEMLITAKRRCWLSVHLPEGSSPKPADQSGRRYEEL